MHMAIHVFVLKVHKNKLIPYNTKMWSFVGSIQNTKKNDNFIQILMQRKYPVPSSAHVHLSIAVSNCSCSTYFQVACRCLRTTMKILVQTLLSYF